MELLIRTPAPISRESLQSYILRLSVANGYESPVHLLRLMGITDHQLCKISFPVGRLAEITGHAVAEFEGILNHKVGVDVSKILDHELKRSASTPQFDLKRAFFCPQCVQDDGYIEAFWSLSYAVGCPKHGCVPITQCDECGEKVSWFRPGLLTCRCGANYADQSLEELDGPVFELMKVICLKVHGLPLGGLKNQCGYPMKDFGELSLSSLLLIMNVLQKQYYKCHAPSAGTHSSAIDASVNVFKNWPQGYHEFLNELGEYYQATRPPESALRKQFELFYLALFKNSSFKTDTDFLKSEFIEFGKGVWGKGHIDKKLLDNQSLTSDMRYLTKSQFCERTGMSPRVLNMIIDSPYINKKTIPRGNGGTRVIIDTRGLLIPDIFIKAVPIREAGASLGVPVSVLKYLKEGLMSTDSLHRGRKETWFVEEVTFLMKSARAHAKPIGFYKQEMVSLQSVLRKKLRSDAVKADIVSAVIEGTLPTESSANDKLSDFLVDKEKVMALIERHKSRKEQSTMTFPEAAKKLGLDPTVIKDAIEQELLVSTVVNGRVRITEESVKYSNEKYIALSGLAKELKTNTGLLLRLCEANKIDVVSLKRNSKVGNRGYQSIILRASSKKLVLAREAELNNSKEK